MVCEEKHSFGPMNSACSHYVGVRGEFAGLNCLKRSRVCVSTPDIKPWVKRSSEEFIISPLEETRFSERLQLLHQQINTTFKPRRHREATACRTLNPHSAPATIFIFKISSYFSCTKDGFIKITAAERSLVAFKDQSVLGILTHANTFHFPQK